MFKAEVPGTDYTKAMYIFQTRVGITADTGQMVSTQI